MWFAHTYFGQITVFMLALGLWTMSPIRSDLKNCYFGSGRLAFFVYFLTSKVFSLISLFGCWKEVLKVRTIFFGIILFVGMHFLVLISSPLFSISNSPHLLTQLYSEWIHAASSGGTELGVSVVRGQQNHGVTAAILRALQVDPTRVSYDIVLCSFLALFFSGMWGWFSKNLKLEEKWSGWLAIGVIAHPLAWHHSFVMAYPLCALALQRAVETRRKVLAVWALIGASSIGILVPQVVGPGAVRSFELFANKSWGVVICGVVLILAATSRNQQRTSIQS
jgi:hypothetical protein